MESNSSNTQNTKRYDEQGAAWYVVYTMGYEDKVKQQFQRVLEI